MIDRLGIYDQAGVDEIIISAGFGQSQKDLIESMHRIKNKVMPFFSNKKTRVA